MGKDKLKINRAPVLTLWATVVAERLGHDPDTALTLGKAVAGLNAQSKGRSLGIFKTPATKDDKPPKKSGLGEDRFIELCGRSVPAKKTPDGLRAVIKDKPIEPDQVRAYLSRAFGDALPAARKSMAELTKSFNKKTLAESAFALYEKFRPTVARGQGGWGQKADLDLKRIRYLASNAM